MTARPRRRASGHSNRAATVPQTHPRLKIFWLSSVIHLSEAQIMADDVNLGTQFTGGEMHCIWSYSVTVPLKPSIGAPDKAD
jgi:hypothetical protein